MRTIRTNGTVRFYTEEGTLGFAPQNFRLQYCVFRTGAGGADVDLRRPNPQNHRLRNSKSQSRRKASPKRSSI